jgi:hypothetical protein
MRYYSNDDRCSKCQCSSDIHASRPVLRWSDTNIIADHVNKQHCRNMVTRYNQHGKRWFYSLYIYTNCRSVRNYYNDDGCSECECNTDIHTSRSLLRGRDACDLGDHINEWHHRNMVTCCNQHGQRGINGLYIYTNCRSVRYHCNNDRCSKCQCNTDIHTSRSILRWSDTSIIADHLNKQHYRNMVTRYNQHGQRRINGLYIYSNCRTMR